MLNKLLILGFTVLKRFIKNFSLKNTPFINRVYRSLR